MFRYENALPKLPLPQLQDTAERYLHSIKPFVKDSEYECSKQAVEDFVRPGSLGQDVQEQLRARAHDPAIHNWLHEWWTEMYLSSRASLFPSPYYYNRYHDDPKRPDPDTRAAALAVALLHFQEQVTDGTLEPDWYNGRATSMSAYLWMFNCCRIPGEDVDWVERSNPSADEDHILVVRRNIFFTIRIKHAGKRLNAAELRLQISRVRATAYSLHVDYPGVGILTTEERRTWYEARNRLMRSDPEINGTALRAIQSAAFLIALDDARPQTREARAHQAWHGGSACHSNRWHDRPMNFSVCDNGFVGWSGEHSTMDGSVSHRLHDTINQWMFQEKLDFDVRDEFIRIADLPAPEQIFFHLDESNLRDITTATTKHIARFSNQEVHCEEFREYGKDEIKRIFQCSPTAFLQLAMQVAYNRISGSTRATYAGVGANQYRDGRTETVRIVSPESIIFCQTMANPIASRCEKLDALNSALAVVVQRYHDSLDGRGFDRHLWALEKLTRAHCDSTGAIVPSMFRDPAYTRSQTWHLSTTQRASAWYDGGGFAQVEDDGIGVAFHVFQHRIQFNIASLGPACVTMGKAIREAAIELRDLGLNRTASKGYDTANL